MCRYNWHRAGSVGRPFFTLHCCVLPFVLNKDCHVFYFSNKIRGSTRKLLRIEITKMPSAFKNELVVSITIILGALVFPVVSCSLAPRSAAVRRQSTDRRRRTPKTTHPAVSQSDATRRVSIIGHLTPRRSRARYQFVDGPTAGRQHVWSPAQIKCLNFAVAAQVRGSIVRHATPRLATS